MRPPPDPTRPPRSPCSPRPLCASKGYALSLHTNLSRPPSSLDQSSNVLMLSPKPSCCDKTTVLPLCYPCATPVLSLWYPCATPVVPLCYPCAAPVLPLCYPCATPVLPLGYLEDCPSASPLPPLCYPCCHLIPLAGYNNNVQGLRPSWIL